MKKLISIALLTIIPLVLTGCNSNNNQNANRNNTRKSATKIVSKQNRKHINKALSNNSKSTKSTTNWDKNKDVQLAYFMASWNQTTQKNYVQCTPKRNTTYTGLHYPNDFADNKTAFNDQKLSAGWSEDGTNKYDVNVVAIYENTNGGATVGGCIYLFAIQDNSPIVYYTEQNQGAPDGLVHFEIAPNDDLTNKFNSIVRSSSNQKNTSSSSKTPEVSPLTFEEGMQILQHSIYKDCLGEDSQLVSNKPQRLVISAFSGARGINYFTLTLEKNNQVRIHAEIGSLEGGPRDQFNAGSHIPEYQTVTRTGSY
ncbi:DUF4767 domain-containing protein [Pediococcus acidilactici]|jgi:hypothetical protein|uniref:DUF4767 domain-containing protein n=1 Tax=Pediococcus acidilactici TaxID=1254 RepID=UPI000947834D|nr:DUF4767 domain-containing protein [Pediococcus acidilactici]APR28940.1 DUF4767 domain-containing protein [Pediococcus acidilactici]